VAIAIKRGTLKAMKDGKAKLRTQLVETQKASIRARVEHPFRVIKRQFGLLKVRFRGVAARTDRTDKLDQGGVITETGSRAF
jgi:transposase, IS5 family